jgi:hypothetical protein
VPLRRALIIYSTAEGIGTAQQTQKLEIFCLEPRERQ